MITYMKIMGIIGYLLLSTVALDIRLTKFRVDEHSKPYECKRKATPLDVWIAVLWPVWLSCFLIKIILCILHILVGYGLLMFGIRYIETEQYNRINQILE